MPRVGKGKAARHFDYTPEGIAMAKAMAKRTGDSMDYGGKSASGKKKSMKPKKRGK